MENKRDRLVVIFAGYSNEMAAFMNTNPGIRSRISKAIAFPDYSKDELVDIFYYEMNKRGFILDSVDRDDVCKMIVERINDKDFGNARGVRNICDIVERNMSYRLNSEIKRNMISDEELVKILSDDLYY